MRDRQCAWEWCEDRYGTYALGEVTDPVGTERDTRVARGGGWSDQAQLVRAAKRVALEPMVRSATLGFRLVIGSCPADDGIHGTTPCELAGRPSLARVFA